MQVQHLVSRWGTDPNSLGCYSYDAVGKPEDLYDKLRLPLGNLFFAGEAVSMENQGSVHGAYSSGIMAAENCRRYLLERLGNFEMIQLISGRDEDLEATVPLQISRMWNVFSFSFKQWISVCSKSIDVLWRISFSLKRVWSNLFGKPFLLDCCFTNPFEDPINRYVGLLKTIKNPFQTNLDGGVRQERKTISIFSFPFLFFCH